MTGTRKVRDGVMRATMATVDATADPRELVQSLAVFQGAVERIEAHREKMSQALASGIDGPRREYAEVAHRRLGWAIDYFQRITNPTERDLAQNAMVELIRGMELVLRADVKGVEPQIITGAKARGGSEIGNKSKTAAAEHDRATWQEAANKLWARRPALTKSDVAGMIDPARAGYIRKRITKPTR